MGPIFKNGASVKVKGSGPGIHRGKTGEVVDNQCSKIRPLYEAKFPDGSHGFFEEDELEEAGGYTLTPPAFLY